MSIISNLDKNNLHHAYLIEGNREDIVAEILKFLEELEFNIIGNADFSHIAFDSLKIDDARNLKSFANEKANSAGKKIFMISANSILLEAQNSLLKLFEEPIDNTHFFIIVPDVHALLKTFISRFYLISARDENKEDLQVAEIFMKMPLQKRIDFIKELLAEEDEEDEDGNEIIVLNSSRAKAGKFLNALESTLHKNFIKDFERGRFQQEAGGIRRNLLENSCAQIFQVRKSLRMPGSSSKTLLESLALIIPVL